MDVYSISAIGLAAVLTICFFRFIVYSSDSPSLTVFQKLNLLTLESKVTEETRFTYLKDILGHLVENPLDGSKVLPTLISHVLPREIGRNSHQDVQAIIQILVQAHSRDSVSAFRLKPGTMGELLEWAEMNSETLKPGVIYSLSSALSIFPDIFAVQILMGFLEEFLEDSLIRSSKDIDGAELYGNEILSNQLLKALGACASKSKENLGCDIGKASESILASSKSDDDSLVKEREIYLEELEVLRKKPWKGDTGTDQEFNESMEDQIKAKMILGSIDSINKKINTPLVIRGLKKRQVSPIEALLMVLRDEQHFGTFVRQGALSGLIPICENGRTDDEKSMIADSIRNAMAGLESFEVRVPKKSSLGELVLSVSQTAELCGMENKISTLSDTLFEIQRELPKFIDFIHHFPLRLINENRFSEYLGFLLTEGYRLQHWIRYVPPNEVGRVLERYLRIDDRTRPNSIGVLPSLLLDKLLVLPILYHEYLHYAGTDSNGNAPIPNEAEVWLREQIYLRFLFSKYAYTEARIFWVVDLLIHQFYFGLLRTDAEKLFCLAPDTEAYAEFINHLIQKLYGERLSEKEAEVFAEKSILRENHYIRQLNDNISWCPEVKWPMVVPEAEKPHDEETREKMRKLIINRRNQKNHIDKDDMDRIFQDRDVRHQMEKWNSFKRKFRSTFIQ